MSAPPEPLQWTAGLTDADLRNTLLSALRLLAIAAVLGAAVLWWKMGWQSAALLGVGAGISAASLWEWMRLMTALNEQMDHGATSRPLGLTLAGFFLRLALTVAVLYVSLKHLHGTVFALAGGLGLGAFALAVEALRLLKRWTV